MCAVAADGFDLASSTGAVARKQQAEAIRAADGPSRFTSAGNQWIVNLH
jgi:hypothetical protein